MYAWPVVPLCERQLRDVNPEDILCNGLYRRCNIYKGGGGYDKFEEIYHKRFGGEESLNMQFVVQLRGCSLACPYCYVTKDGIWGKATHVETDRLVEDFSATGYPVFHLMGGAPAKYMEFWHEILDILPEYAVFHSDFLLQEKVYLRKVCQQIARHKRSLHAVSIKGGSPEEFQKNTGVALNTAMLWHNLDVLIEEGVQFYLTYTGMSEESIAHFKESVSQRYGDKVLEDSFAIDIIHYNALD